MTENNWPYQEPPVSWTIRYRYEGYDCMLTLREHTANALLSKAKDVVAWLSKNGAEPLGPQPIAQPEQPEAEQKPEGWCSIHAVQMKKYTKNGGNWYSHRLADGSWCHG